MTTQELFLKYLSEAEYLLIRMGFKQSYIEKKGYATFVHYSKQDTTVKFIFGPPEYHVEMLISTLKRQYAFKDLLQIPAVQEWTKRNKYTQGQENHIKPEILWFINLLEFVLPILEQ